MTKYYHEIANLPFLDAFISQNISELYLLHVYGFRKKVLIFIYSYLKYRKQNVKTKDVYNPFQV